MIFTKEIKKTHYLRTMMLFFLLLLLSIPLYIFFSKISLLLPFLGAIFYYFYPIYKFEKTRYSEVENAFVLSLLIASYSYIYKDVFNAVVLSIKSFNKTTSSFVNTLSRTIWKNLSRKKDISLSSLSNVDFVKSIDPSFQDVLSLISSSLKEGTEKSLSSIKAALTFHSTSIFSKILEKSRNSVNPIRVVFSVLVVFPVFLLIMLPLAVLFLPEIVNPSNLFLVFNVILPLSSFGLLEWYSVHLLTKPSFYSFKSKNVQYALFIFLTLFIFVSFLSLFFSNSLYVVFSFLLFSLINFSFFHVLFYSDYKKLVLNYQLIEKLPSFFVVLSKQLSKGIPFEKAIIDAEKKEGIKVNSAMFLLGMDRLKMSKVLSSYSYFIDILREATKKSITNEIAEVINHFLNLKKESEEKIRFINEETLHSAKLLALIVIPIIASVSSSFSDSLDSILSVFSFNEINFFTLDSQPFLLTYILSLYTIEMVIILTIFVVKLEGIKDVFYVLYKISKNLALSFIVFVVGYMLSTYFINMSTVII